MVIFRDHHVEANRNPKKETYSNSITYLYILEIQTESIGTYWNLDKDVYSL